MVRKLPLLLVTLRIVLTLSDSAGTWMTANWLLSCRWFGLWAGIGWSPGPLDFASSFDGGCRNWLFGSTWKLFSSLLLTFSLLRMIPVSTFASFASVEDSFFMCCKSNGRSLPTSRLCRWACVSIADPSPRAGGVLGSVSRVVATVAGKDWPSSSCFSSTCVFRSINDLVKGSFGLPSVLGCDSALLLLPLLVLDSSEESSPIFCTIFRIIASMSCKGKWWESWLSCSLLCDGAVCCASSASTLSTFSSATWSLLLFWWLFDAWEPFEDESSPISSIMLRIIDSISFVGIENSIFSSTDVCCGWRSPWSSGTPPSATFLSPVLEPTESFVEESSPICWTIFLIIASISPPCAWSLWVWTISSSMRISGGVPKDNFGLRVSLPSSSFTLDKVWSTPSWLDPWEESSFIFMIIFRIMASISCSVSVPSDSVSRCPEGKPLSFRSNRESCIIAELAACSADSCSDNDDIDDEAIDGSWDARGGFSDAGNKFPNMLRES